METIDLVLDKVQIEEDQDLRTVEDQVGPKHKQALNIIIVDVVSEVVVVIEVEEETMGENPGNLDREPHIK